MYEESATHEIAPAAAEANGPSRRQLVKAGIWAAPVVVLATASPAAAVSITAKPSLTGTQQSGLNARSWNVVLTVAGTVSPKAWTVQAIVDGGPVTITDIPSSIAAAGTSNGVVTLANWGSTATVFFRLTNGSTTWDTNAITVTSPATTFTLASGPSVSGTGNTKTVVFTTTVANSTAVPSGSLSWTRVAPNGGTSTGTASPAAPTVTGAYPTFTLTFTVPLDGNSGTKTATATLTLAGAPSINIPTFNLP